MLLRLNFTPGSPFQTRTRAARLRLQYRAFGASRPSPFSAFTASCHRAISSTPPIGDKMTVPGPASNGRKNIIIVGGSYAGTFILHLSIVLLAITYRNIIDVHTSLFHRSLGHQSAHRKNARHAPRHPHRATHPLQLSFCFPPICHSTRLRAQSLHPLPRTRQ